MTITSIIFSLRHPWVMIDNGCECGFGSFGLLPQTSTEFKLSVKCAPGHTYDSPTSPYGPVHELGGSWVVRSKANRSAAVWSIRLGGEMTRISERFAVGKMKKSNFHFRCTQRVWTYTPARTLVPFDSSRSLEACPNLPIGKKICIKIPSRTTSTTITPLQLPMQRGSRGSSSPFRLVTYSSRASTYSARCIAKTTLIYNQLT